MPVVLQLSQHHYCDTDNVKKNTQLYCSMISDSCQAFNL